MQLLCARALGISLGPKSWVRLLDRIGPLIVVADADPENAHAGWERQELHAPKNPKNHWPGLRLSFFLSAQPRICLSVGCGLKSNLQELSASKA